MLVADGTLTGVVDWDGAGRGDRRLDLVTFRFSVHGCTSEPGVVDRLDALLDAMPADVVRTAWAYMSLRMVDWAIRHFPAPRRGALARPGRAAQALRAGGLRISVARLGTMTGTGIDPAITGEPPEERAGTHWRPQ